MKTIITYFPSNHDASEEQLNLRISEYLSKSFLTTKNEGYAYIEFEENLSNSELKDLDMAMITLGYNRF
jgi:hypothetical protein